MATIVDPELQADIVRELNVRGVLAPFQISEVAIPVFDIGRLAGLAPQVVTTTAGSQGVRVGLSAADQFLGVAEPATDDGDNVDGGIIVNPGAANVNVDSGQLAAGQHVITAIISANVVVDFRIEWRDAANAVTLASWTILSGGPSAVPFQFKMNAAMLLNERVRVVNIAAVVGTVACSIHASPTFVSFAQ